MCYTRRKIEGGVDALRESDDTNLLTPNGQSRNLNIYGYLILQPYMFIPAKASFILLICVLSNKELFSQHLSCRSSRTFFKIIRHRSEGNMKIQLHYLNTAQRMF